MDEYTSTYLKFMWKKFFYTFLVFISESEKLRNQQHIVREGTKINKINIYNFWKDH